MERKRAVAMVLTLFVTLIISTVLVMHAVAVHPSEDILKNDLTEIANSVSQIEQVYIDYWLWSDLCKVKIDYTPGLSDYEKVDLQYYVQYQLEPKWYVRYVQPNYIYCTMWLDGDCPPWPGFVIGELLVGVKGISYAPIANFTYSPTFPYVGQTVTFDASSSPDPDGTIVSYEWDFGDGSTGTDILTSYTYESAGTFNVTLTVTNDLGATDTLQQEITVDPLPTLTITINKIKKGTTETILLELVDDDYDGFIAQDVDKRLRGIIRRTHKTTTFDFPGTYTVTKGALNVTLQSRNDFTITLS